MTMELTFGKGVLSSECLKVNSIVAFCGILRGELMFEKIYQRMYGNMPSDFFAHESPMGASTNSIPRSVHAYIHAYMHTRIHTYI